MKARVVLRRGARWRVGDGMKIKIWGDNSLPIEGIFKVLSPIPTGVEHDTTVDNLPVDNSSLQWNRELINSIFYEEEEKLI